MMRQHLPRDDDGRVRLYADIAHPINTECREMIQRRVVEEYSLEVERAKKPGYVSRYDHIDFDPPEPHFKDRSSSAGSPSQSSKAETGKDGFGAGIG